MRELPIWPPLFRTGALHSCLKVTQSDRQGEDSYREYFRVSQLPIGVFGSNLELNFLLRGPCMISQGICQSQLIACGYEKLSNL